MQSLKPSFSSTFSGAFNPRQWWTIAIVVMGLLLVTVISAPNSPQSIGSTYSKSPEGYGAWYAYMEAKGEKVERLRQPIDQSFLNDYNNDKGNTTILQILADENSLSSGNSFISQPIHRAWVEKGNRWVIVGTRKIPNGKTVATPADFISPLMTPNQGALTIATSRRYRLNLDRPATLAEPATHSLLKDNYGSLVLETKIGRGSMVYVLPQFIAANAYQDAQNNFAYLRSLVKNDRILVDEYLHGYRDQKAAKEEQEKPDAFEFLARTPLLLIFIQACIAVGVLIYGKNWRWGPVRSIDPPPVNNSRAYIQALAGILQKANSTDFVTDTLSKAELAQLQRALGLGNAPQDPAQVIQLWSQQTGQSPQTLERIFLSLRRQRKLSEAELTQWLARLQTLSTATKPATKPKA